MKSLTIDQLYRHCPVPFDVNTHPNPLTQLQSRLYEAVSFAIENHNTHVCVLGSASLGKLEIIRELVQQKASQSPAWFYVFSGDQSPATPISVSAENADDFALEFEKCLRHAEIAAKLHWNLPEIQLLWQQKIEQVSENVLHDFEFDQFNDWFQSLSETLLSTPFKNLSNSFNLDQKIWATISQNICETFARLWRNSALNDDKLNGFGVGHSTRCILVKRATSSFALNEQLVTEAEDLVGSYGQNWLAPGALHLANQGGLILDAAALLENEALWYHLKDCILQQRICPLPDDSGSNQNLAPVAMPLDTTIILFADDHTLARLNNLDPSFNQIFSVIADGEEEITRTAENSQAFMHWLKQLASEQQYLPLDANALSRLEEFAARNAEDQEMIDLQRWPVISILQLANNFAIKRAAPQIQFEDVENAILANENRYARQAELYRSDILRNIKILHTDGERCGEINGLFVTEDAGFSFGHPARITATARAGEHKFIDIEAESDLGGEIHTKGGLILSHFLAARYARERNLSLSASIVMEQSYGGVDGDSASLAELCALLSAIADIPLKQSFAMTGAIDQLGNVQAIGGVDEKIEGFFEICKLRGLNGQHSVIIPTANAQHLMLKQPLIDAVKAGQFHVYAVSTVDQAMQLMSGLEPGTRDTDGAFPDGSINQRVEDALYRMAAIMQDEEKPEHAQHPDTEA